MISTQGSLQREEVACWLSSLKAELSLLEMLAEVAPQARAVSPNKEGAQRLHALLERQAELCAELEGHRRSRARTLAEEGLRANDLLVVVLGALPKEEHPSAVETFSKYVEAAEAAQREIDINREFFSVALATLEDTIESVVSGVCASGVYDASGSSQSSKTPLCVSTVT